MGLPDLYPFVLAPAVVAKLTFIHDSIHSAASAGRVFQGRLRMPGDKAPRHIGARGLSRADFC